MVDTNTKIAGNSLKIRGTFYVGGDDTKASLTTNISTNANLNFIAKEAGIGGNDISISYVDTGLEDTDFALSVENGRDIICTLERTHSRAFYQTTNSETDANVKFTAAASGTSGNSISIALAPNTDTPVVISSCAIASKVVTITTATAHGYVAGDIVGITGLNEDDVCGCWQVATVADTTHFTYGIENSLTATVATGYGVASKGAITVATNAISIASPQGSSGEPILTPKALIKLWGRTSAAKALAICEMVGDTGDKPIGFISQRYLTNGKTSAISTTALDIKRAIEADTTATKLVDIFVPQNTTGVDTVTALSKTFLTGGSNLIKYDPDDQDVVCTIYDINENVLATSDLDYIADHPELDIDTIESVIRSSIGEYYIIYAPDEHYRQVSVEFKGNINGEMTLSRKFLTLDWALSDTTTTTTTTTSS